MSMYVNIDVDVPNDIPSISLVELQENESGDKVSPSPLASRTVDLAWVYSCPFGAGRVAAFGEPPGDET
jgi:hypothetical protein